MAPYRVLAWGCGTQSTLLAELSLRGKLAPLDLILTADPGWEGEATYAIRAYYAERWRGLGLRVEILPRDDIRRRGAEEHIHIPFWTDGGGPLRRQCTREFKIRPMRRFTRRVLGFAASRAPAPLAGAVELWLGITTDEWTRATRSDVAFVVHRWPLLELGLSRRDCMGWYPAYGLPVPGKSACLCCPYRRASEWLALAEGSGFEFAEACAFDAENRDNPLAGRGGSTADELYVYRARVGLAEADLERDAERERRVWADQLPLFGCEGGLCGV